MVERGRVGETPLLLTLTDSRGFKGPGTDVTQSHRLVTNNTSITHICGTRLRERTVGMAVQAIAGFPSASRRSACC